MRRLRDSSEVREAVDLLGNIIRETPPREGGQAGSRGERLRRVLGRMCARSGFAAAAVTDGTGLPLAAHALPFPAETAGALASVLGTAMERVADVAGERNVSSISVDVSLVDKLVVRRLSLPSAAYYLLVLCAQTVDEHAEIELSVDELRAIVEAS
jgi:predicted regulator of Ras-like GTPase activity (Roadblock/LC7/MglB family)